MTPTTDAEREGLIDARKLAADLLNYPLYPQPGDTVEAHVAALEISFARTIQAAIDRATRARPVVTETIRDAWVSGAEAMREQCRDACSEARKGAERHYGVAEGVGAAMAYARVEKLPVPECSLATAPDAAVRPVVTGLDRAAIDFVRVEYGHVGSIARVLELLTDALAIALDASAGVGVGQAVGWALLADGYVELNSESRADIESAAALFPDARIVALVPIDPPAEGGEG